MTRAQKMTPFLWFDRNAEEAVSRYLSIFKNSRIVSLSRYGDVGPLPKGTLLSVVFELEGQRFKALNSGPHFKKFTDATAVSVSCATQTDLDGLWERLSAGGEKRRYGWLKDRFGLSWRIVPPALGEMIQYKDAGRSNRVTALMRMSKLENRRFERRRRFVAGHDRLSAAILPFAKPVTRISVHTPPRSLRTSPKPSCSMRQMRRETPRASGFTPRP